MNYKVILSLVSVHELTIMKLLAVILSFYILGLSFVPCADDHANVLDGDCISLVQEQGDHSPFASEIELCSPFCFCTCCQPVSQPEHSEINIVSPIAQSIAIPIIADIATNPVIDFWRPPKIGYTS
jgi:hypothetical protein